MIPTDPAQWKRLQRTLAFGPPPFTMAPEVAMALRAIIAALDVPRNRFGKLDGPAESEMWEVAKQLGINLPNGGEDSAHKATMILQCLVGDEPTFPPGAKPKARPRPPERTPPPRPTGAAAGREHDRRTRDSIFPEPPRTIVVDQTTGLLTEVERESLFKSEPKK